MRFVSRIRSFAGWLAILPPLAVVATIYFFAVDVPLIDDWNLLQSYDRWLKGDYGLSDFFSSHGGHRILIPRLLMFGLGYLSDWNENWLIWSGFVCVIATFLIVCRGLGIKVQGQHDTFHATASLLGVSALVFSLAQWEVWLWGLPASSLIYMTAVSGACFLLTRKEIGAIHIGSAVLAGWVATLCSAGGLIVWIVGFLILAGRRVGNLPIKAWHATIWFVISVGTFSSYFHDLTTGSETNSFQYLLGHPWQLIYFFLSVVGYPISSFGGSAWPPRDTGIPAVAGLFGCFMFLWSIARFPRTKTEIKPYALFALGLMLFSLGIAAQTSLSRVGLGAEAALASRYTTSILPLWIAVFWQVGQIGVEPGTLNRTVGATGLWILLLLTVFSGLYPSRYFTERRQVLALARAQLARGTLNEFTVNLHPDQALVQSGIDILRRRHLSVFRPNATPNLVLPVALSHLNQEISVAKSDIECVANSAFKIGVWARNPGPQDWPVAAPIGNIVHLSYHWLHEDGSIALFDGARTQLDRDVAPFQTVFSDMRVIAPETPGNYRLYVSLVQEGVNWFDAAGAATINVSVSAGNN